MLDFAASSSSRHLAAVAAGVALLFAGLSLTTPWQQLELKGFDALTVATAPGASSLPITLVGIDEASFAQVGRQWPWPRSVYARLIEQLSASGALVIVLDVVLSEPDRDPAEDAALARAIEKSGNVVIASDLAYQESQYARQWLRVDPLEMFKRAGAGNGLANVPLDGDVVVRKMPDGADVFWREIVRKAAQRQPAITAAEPGPGAMIRYAGPYHTFPAVSLYQALDADKLLPADAFRDQIVIIGRDVKASPDAGAAQADLFLTPFTSSSGWFTPGFEVHANILETAIAGTAIRPVPRSWSIALIMLAAVGSAVAMRRWRPAVSALAAAVSIALLALLAVVLFTRSSLWLPVFGAGGSIVSIYLGFGALAFAAERRRKGELRRAFALYVSPEVVDHVMAHPEKLVLGGEHREVTMLFTDLAGFTTITEEVGAEQVARILNMHFSRATAIVKRHGGTVNRFIGDAVMAMWGAPLADPQHPLRACRAACEMQQDMDRLRDDLAAQGLPPIWMRVGIHTCTAIVGNLGSADRFDYTAIGDGVNLAARLEGVNKLYGTPILLSGETVSRLGGELGVRVVDRVIVKGKSEPVDIFTPCDDPVAAEASDRAIRAYRAQRWDESEGFWRHVQERIAGDGVARVHLQRIAACRGMPADTAWRGVAELEKL